MTRNTWKATERALARDVRTERIPVTGRQRDKGGSDFSDGFASYQCKDGYAQPAYLEKWMRDAEEYARPRDCVPVVVWHRRGQRRKDSLVVLRWSDWVDLHGPATPAPDDSELPTAEDVKGILSE